MSREQERSRLIELMKKLDGNFKRTCPAYNDPNIGFEELGNCTGCKYQTGKDDCDYIARATDYLLDNGVIIPPVKVGDKVWRRGGYSFRVVEIDIHKNHTIFRCGNDGTDDYMAFDISDIGKTVFLTREEAEATLEKPRAEANNDR